MSVNMLVSIQSINSSGKSTCHNTRVYDQCESTFAYILYIFKGKGIITPLKARITNHNVIILFRVPTSFSKSLTAHATKGISYFMTSVGSLVLFQFMTSVGSLVFFQNRCC